MPRKAFQRQHLSDFVVARVQEPAGERTLDWQMASLQWRALELTRLGRHVLCMPSGQSGCSQTIPRPLHVLVAGLIPNRSVRKRLSVDY